MLEKQGLISNTKIDDKLKVILHIFLCYNANFTIPVMSR